MSPIDGPVRAIRSSWLPLAVVASTAALLTVADFSNDPGETDGAKASSSVGDVWIASERTEPSVLVVTKIIPRCAGRLHDYPRRS